MSITYESMQKELAKGWNTWNTRSVLSHVLLPEGFALNLGLRDYVRGRQLKEALIGRRNPEDEKIYAGPHTYDGRYSELTLKWLGNEIFVQSATIGEDLVLLITPLSKSSRDVRSPLLIVEGGILWNRPGYITLVGETLVGHFDRGEIPVYATENLVSDVHVWSQGPYLAFKLDGAVGISTGHKRELMEIQGILETPRMEHLKHFEHYGELAEVYKAVQTSMAWDTIYEPEHQRVVTPVSRIWNVNWGGYVLFEWDNYFAAYMAATENKEIAYANAVEMTREITESGFVPNFASANGVSSRDRSEPPVGALMCRELYRIYADRWFLEEVFPNLLRWNRWWYENRDFNGLLCWGSDPYQPVNGSYFEVNHINEWQGGAYEAGLDNSPVFDEVPFDSDKHLLLLHDTGLNGLYVADCEALADIAAVLGKASEEEELRQRGEHYRKALSRLWDEQRGIYLNHRADTGEATPRISPTSFYPLIAKAATQVQAERLIREHFNNPKEFWGEWMIPTISRDDSAYPDQDYWRGRIWGPMNLLVYLGLRKYNLSEACHALAKKSRDLLLKEWLANGHVHENYNADTGEGCDKKNSDAFYHWGGLLGLIALIDSGHLPPPEAPL
jgi:putative isomerase